MGRVRVIVDDVVGVGQASLAVELGGEDRIDLWLIQPIALFEPFPAQRLRGVDHEDAVHHAGLFCLDEQGNGEDAIGGLEVGSLVEHCLADGGMEDGLQLFPFNGIGEDKGAQSGAIQLAVGGEYLFTKGAANLHQGGLTGLDHLARDDVGVDDRDVEFGEERADSGFAAADATGKADVQHT